MYKFKYDFNTTLVLFKRKELQKDNEGGKEFQYHTGSIQTEKKRLYNNRKNRDFNTTLVLFKQNKEFRKST